MKNKITLILLCLVMGFNSYSQSSKDKYIFASSSINYYPKFEPYNFSKTYEVEQLSLDLTFLTQDSGIFFVDSLERTVDLTTTSQFPTQIFNIGASFQIRKMNSTFQEIAVSRFSRFNSSYLDAYKLQDTTGRMRDFVVGYEQKSFILSLRYEYGKMFGNRKSRVRFGLSGVVEPTIYSYKRDYFSTQDYPIRTNIFSLHVSLSPILAFKLSKKIFLDFKLIPRFLIADFGEVRKKDPALSPEEQAGIREYNLPELDLAGTIQVRYVLKEPKRRRRRTND